MTREAYMNIIDSFDVENNPEYQPSGGKTYCNIFAQDVAKTCRHTAAHWWLHGHAGKPVGK